MDGRKVGMGLSAAASAIAAAALAKVVAQKRDVFLMHMSEWIGDFERSMNMDMDEELFRVDMGMGEDEVSENLVKATASGIYHVPGSPYYDRLRKVSIYFPSAQAAEEAGYRAPGASRKQGQQ